MRRGGIPVIPPAVRGASAVRTALAIAALLAGRMGASEEPAPPTAGAPASAASSAGTSGTTSASTSATIDEWLKIHLEGKPAGYWHVRALPREGGGFNVEIDEELSVKRGSDVARTRKRSVVEEAEDGKLIRFVVEEWLSDQPTRVEGILPSSSISGTSPGRLAKGSVFLVTRTDGGREPRTSEVPFDRESIGMHRVRQVLRSSLRKPGDEVTLTVFLPEPQILRSSKQKYTLVGREPAEDGGGGGWLHVTSTLDLLPGMVQDEWYDEEMNLQKLSLRVSGLTFSARRSTLKDVLAEDFASPPEIFLSTAVRPTGKSLRDAKSLAEYRLSLREGSFQRTGTAFRAAGQDLLREDEPASRVIRVRRLEPERAISRPVAAPPELAECIRPNSYLQSDHALIVSIAEKALGGEKDAWKSAKVLERWVHENIREKDMKTPFATALEVARYRKGDCTEHSVLLAALLRAAGLPSRVAAGLVASDGVFVGHMWAEVYLGDGLPGGWAALDATRGEDAVAADRIAFSVSSLDTSGLPGFFLEVLQAVGNLEIEVLEAR